MAKRPINYTSRDFESIKDDLVNYAKRYYPTTYKDFNEASFGSMMLDLVAYVGDQLSFYADYQANESFLDSAIEYKNIVRLCKQLGYKLPGSARSTGTCSFYIKVPASSTTRGPDLSYFPILQRGTLLSSTGGATYTLIENVDFTNSNNEITVAAVDPDTGSPTSYAVRARGQVVSGQKYEETISVGEYVRFRKVLLSRKSISEIISVKDAQGNEYYEVDYLTENVVFKETPNYNSDRDVVPYIMLAKPVPRRFSIEHDSSDRTFLQFGYGSAANLTGDLIADPADVVMDVSGRDYIQDKTFDPTNLITGDKFGVAPSSTTLSIVYTANDSISINAPVSTIKVAVTPSFSFQNEASLVKSSVNTVIASLEVDNEQPILGDTSALTGDEIRTRAYATFASQNRAVTRGDYISLCYRMPSKFGRIKRANVVQDPDSFKRNINLYILSENKDNNFVAANQTIKENLKVWLNRHRMINDTIDVLDGRIINVGINFEVLGDLDINRYELLQRCTNYLKNNLIKVKKNIGEAFYISDVFKMLNDVPGVTDTISVEMTNKAGGVYSEYVYDINSNLSDDGRFLKIPPDAVAEILLPELDISGVVK
tara:strand:- start:8870 stop:10663 length:1794 start_codon:yes stop_codon:yes gene_type:complete